MPDDRARPDRRFCAAPMMRHSHSPARRLWRELCPGGMVYTEMAVAEAVVRGDPARMLGFNPGERPLGLQLAGNDPSVLARCARTAERLGYDEVNLNAGCPSERVRKGNFGACLMREPRLVADCVRAMRDACALPVTVKTRIAVDELDPGPCLDRMAEELVRAAADAIIVHARKAWTQGLDPRRNRTVPPLDYGRVRKLKRDFPELEALVNGGIRTADEIEEHLQYADGVMCGRAVVRDPMLLAEVSARLLGRETGLSRAGAVRRALELAAGLAPRQWPQAARATLGLLCGVPNGRALRRALCAARGAAEALRAMERLGFA